MHGCSRTRPWSSPNPASRARAVVAAGFYVGSLAPAARRTIAVFDRSRSSHSGSREVCECDASGSIIDCRSNSCNWDAVTELSEYSRPPPHWTHLTEEQIHGFARFVRTEAETISGSNFFCVWQWIGVVGSFAVGCVDIEPGEFDVILDSLKHVVAFGEVALAKKAAEQLARFTRDQQWLAATAAVWLTTPTLSIAERPWRYPFWAGELVSKSSSDVGDELAAVLCMAGAGLANNLLQVGLLAEPDREALVEATRNSVIPIDAAPYLW